MSVVATAMVHSIPLQQNTKLLRVLRLNDHWVVWVAGTATTHIQTYLQLYDNGAMRRVTEGPGRFDVVTLVEATQTQTQTQTQKDNDSAQ